MTAPAAEALTGLLAADIAPALSQAERLVDVRRRWPRVPAPAPADLRTPGSTWSTPPMTGLVELAGEPDARLTELSSLLLGTLFLTDHSAVLPALFGG